MPKNRIIINKFRTEMTNGRTIFKNVENSNMFTRLIVDIITVSVDTYVDNVFRQYVEIFLPIVSCVSRF